MTLKDDVMSLISGDQDKKIDVITTLTEQRLKVLLGNVDSVPKTLEYIVIEVSIKRFNRIGNEGMKTFSQEGESMSFPDSDFKEYADEIQRYLEDNEKGKFKYGKVVFY